MLPRLAALLALVAGAAIVVVVLLAQGGGGDGSGPGASPGRGPSPDAPPHQQRPARVDLPALAPVRNARPQPDWRAHPGQVPILRYDVVGNAPSTASELELFVSPADFRAQMDWLEAHGYEAVGLGTVERSWSTGAPLPAKPIVLSFDGVRGHLLDLVVPDLRRRGWPADLVVDTEALPLHVAATAKLLALGWNLEPSGREPAAARHLVRSRFPTPAKNFAVPSGDSPKPAPSTLKAAGFTGATVNGGGFATPSHRFAMPRITIFNESAVEGFAEAIRSHGEGVGA
jgi:hypothetical protein